jgi:hypothetical protein
VNNITESGRDVKGEPLIRGAYITAPEIEQQRKSFHLRRWTVDNVGLPNPGMQPTAYRAKLGLEPVMHY